MGSGEWDTIDDGGVGKSLSSSCSICLEIVTDNGDRSWAKLQCGHEFHLDCIGSAFNVKGAMQCPNCRKIEKGQWLYASGCNSFSDILDDLPHDDDYYEIFGVQWCPLPALSRLPSFEEGDFPSTTYHNFLGQHTILAEHTAVSSTHQCPYVAYYGPVHSSFSAGSVSDGSNYNNCWAGPGPSEMHTSHAFGAMDPNYHGLEHHSLNLSANGGRLGASEPSSQISSNLPRSGSYVHTYLPSHSYNDRVGSSVTSSMVPPYQGSAARTRDRVQALQAYFEPVSSSPPMHSPTMSNTRRPNNHRTLAQGPHMPSSSAQEGYIVYPRAFPEAENAPISSRFHEWERDHLNLHPVTQANRDSSCLGGSSSFCQFHGRNPSQNW